MNKDAKFSVGGKAKWGKTHQEQGGGRREAGARAATFSTEARQNQRCINATSKQDACSFGLSEPSSDRSRSIGQIQPELKLNEDLKNQVFGLSRRCPKVAPCPVPRGPRHQACKTP
jgi:hypothetical protein